MRFVLVHGGLHGGWCWDQTVAALFALGHQAIAPDLPGHGSRRGEAQTLASYRTAIAEVLEPADVLVGHSTAGAVIGVAAAARPGVVAHTVYLAAPVPIPGRPLADVVSPMSFAAAFVIGSEDFRPGPPEEVNELFYHDCSIETQREAYARLVPQSFRPYLAPVELTEGNLREMPASYISCLDDRTGLLSGVEAGVQRLGIATVHPFWSSHSPFLSRPDALAQLLADIGVQAGKERSAAND